MHQQPLSKWDIKPATEGLLFFAEAIDELCFDHTLDSYRAPALNLHTSALEVESLAQFYTEHEKLGRSALAAAVQELQWHLGNDPVVRLQKRTIAKEFSNVIGSEMRPADLAAYVGALIAEIRSFYWEGLNELIIGTCKDSKRKKDIHSLATTFVGEAELAGFPRAYLYRVNRVFFFSGVSPAKISDPNQVEDFLNFFQAPITDWKVIFRGSSSFDRFSKYHGTYWFKVSSTIPEELETAPRKPAQFLRMEAHRPRYIVFEDIKARCPNAAREVAVRRLEYFADAVTLHFHTFDLSWSPACVVLQEKTNELYLLNEPVSPMKSGVHLLRNRSIENFENCVAIEAGERFTSHSLSAFQRLIEYHRAAFETK